MFKYFINESKGKIPFSGRLHFTAENHEKELNLEWFTFSRFFGIGFSIDDV